MKAFFFILCLITILSNLQLSAQNAMLYPNLEKGKYDIGFKAIIDFDYSRTYNLDFPVDTISQKRNPRPIIINIWYPAKANKNTKPMHYGDYVKIETQNKVLQTFKKRIADYNTRNSINYMFYSDSLNDEQEKKYQEHLAMSINVFKNAAPVNDKFPLVIYHAGLGGTLNDNTVLCEFIASHGFVVMSGAFQSSNFKNVWIDWDLERSTKDIDFMLNSISNLPFIDFTRVAAIGHSYGAQAVLGYKTEDYSTVSWLIILDSTVDYSLEANPIAFSPLTDKLYRKINNVDVPMLVFANPTAIFSVMDSLIHSDRTYITFKSELNHNEFTSLTSLALLNGLQERNDTETVWNKYTTVNNYCLNFLKYKIYNDISAKEFILSKNALTNIYEINNGRKLISLIPEYLDYSKPPTHQQFQKLIKERKTKVIDTLIHIHPDYLNEGIINNAGYSFLNSNIEYAIYLFRINVELFPESWNTWDSLGEGYMVKGEKELAIKNYQKSIELNPDNNYGLRMLEKLSNPND